MGQLFFCQYLCDVDEHKRPRHQLCRCLCLLSTSLGHLAGLQIYWAAAAPSGCPKKSARKSLWFQYRFLVVFFFLDIDYCNLAATSWFLSSEILGILTLLQTVQKHYRKSPGFMLLPGAQVSFTQLKKQFFLVPEESLKSKWAKATIITGAAEPSPTSCPRLISDLKKNQLSLLCSWVAPTHTDLK